MIENLCGGLLYYWKNGKRGLFFLSLLMTISIIIGVIWIGVLLLEVLFTFIALKFDVIMFFVSTVSVIIYMWNTKREEKKERMLKVQEEESAQAVEIERAVAENGYIIIRKCLFTVLSEMANIIGLVKPTTLSEMDSPSRIIPRNGFMLCQFVVMKKGSEVDLKLIKESLQMRIGQKLSAGEFEDIRVRNHIFNGRAYSILYIDEITDTGSYIQINIALVNDAFCQYLENKVQAQYQNAVQTSTVPRDTDF